MPLALDVTTGDGGADSPSDDQYLLLELLGGHDSDAAGSNDCDAQHQHHPHHADVPMLDDALDLELELGLDDLLCDDNYDDNDDDSMSGIAAAALCTDAGLNHPELLFAGSDQPCHMTTLPHASDSRDDCTLVGGRMMDACGVATAAPSSGTRVPAAAAATSSHDSGALITKAVAAAITRRRRPRTAATPKKHRATGSSSSTTTGTTATTIVVATTSSTAAGANTAAVTAKKLLKYNSNKARDERREELLYLRRKVAELEARLTELQITQPRQLGDRERSCVTASDASSPSPSSPPPPPSLSASVSSSASADSPKPAARSPTSAMVKPIGVWQEIAGRQHEHRMQAERENIRLKLVLEHQLKIAKSLEKLLKKTAAAKELDKCARSERVQYLRPPPVDHSDAALFAQLLADVTTSYAEVDTVFDAVGLSRTEATRIDARVQQQRAASSDRRSSGANQHHRIELQVFGSKVLPFEMHATGRAVWHHYVYAKESTPNRLYCHTPAPLSVAGTASTATSEGDTIMESFNMEVAVNSTTVLFCMKLVLRRYIEADRVVIVWRAFFDPTQVSHEPLAGVRFLEKGYVVVRKLAISSSGSGDSGGGSGTDEPHNLLQTCFISTPVSIGDLVHAEPSKVGALTDLVLSSTAANIASSHQMIENVLLEQALQHKSRAGDGKSAL